MTRRRPVLLAGLTLAGVALALSACGSALDQSEVDRASSGTQQQGADGTSTAAAIGDTQGGSGDSGQTGALPDGSVPTGTGGDSGLPDGTSSTGSDPGGSGVGEGSGGGGGGGPTNGASTTTSPTKGSSDAPTAPADNCAGLKNQTGITDSTITIGNTADVSGPAPGVFEGSQDAVRAYLAYFNSTSDICGRKMVLKTYDSKTDGGAEQQAYVAGCSDVFAMIGSMSSFDNAGASAAQNCGLPDLRTTAITVDRLNCTTCFGALSNNPSQFQNAVPDFVLKQFGDAGKHAAMFYLDIGAAPAAAQNQVDVFTKRGMHFDLVKGIGVSEFNYSSYAQEIKDKHIGYVQMIGSFSSDIKLAQAMRSSGYYPTVFFDDPTVYSAGYVAAGGSDVNDTVTFLSITPFEDAASNPALQTYESWLQQVKPGASPDFFGVYGWSAAELFVKTALDLGGKLSRPALVDALKKVDNWTADGLHAPQHVGAKVTGECNRFVQLNDGHWDSIGGTKYLCDGVTKA